MKGAMEMSIDCAGSTNRLRIALAGGGTGGHLFPGLALAGEIRSLGAEVVGLGPGREIERKAAPDWISIPSPRRPGSPAQLIKFPLRAGGAFLHSRRVLRVHNVQGVVGLGGYGSFFPSLAAIAEGIPLFLLEQNAIPGKVTRLLARRARAVYSSWESASLHLHTLARSRTLGNPIRAEALGWTREEALWKWGFRRDLRTLLVIGGSQGARGLNRGILECLRSAPRSKPFQVIHLTGPTLQQELAQAYGVAGLRARVLPFLDAMGAAYAAADLVIARAGGTTIAEIAARGLPSVLVPFPASADGHQEANACQMESAGAGWMLEEKNLGADGWGRIVDLLLGDTERLALARGAEARGRPEAGRRIALDIIEELADREDAVDIHSVGQRGVA